MSTGLQNKILNYEVIPPERIWEKIAVALDESELASKFPSKLYEAEAIPPVSAWKNIAASLDAENEFAKPKYSRIYPILKYAAAAVIIGFVAWGGIQLLNNKSGNNDLVKKNSTTPAKEDLIPETIVTANSEEEKIITADIATIEDDARNDAALEASKKTFAKLDVPARSRIKEIASGFSFASSTENDQMVMTDNASNPSNLSSRYITLMTPEGNIIRVSKKLSDMVCCVSGEEVDEICKEQIKKWQEKIMCTPNCHTTGSFMDILHLMDKL